MLSVLQEPWPWYVTGPLIGLMVPLLLIIGNKSFGISSSLKHACAACFPANIKFFEYNWKKESWNIVFVFGVFAGGFVAGHVFKNPEPIQLSDAAKNAFLEMGFANLTKMAPVEIFNIDNLQSMQGLIFMVLGGFLVGFGTRYANGCTSGHSITGIANLQVSSIVATMCFFAGGLIMNWIIMPYLL